MAKDKDEIPDFDHLNIDGLEPAAEHPAAQPDEQLPDLPLHAGEEPTIDFIAQEPGSEPTAAASDEPTPTEETHAAEGEPEEIEFGISGEAGEEIKAEEEHESEVSEEQLADVAAGRKLNIAALVLIGVGALGVVAAFVLAFLKGVAATWLAIVIGIHYAALPALLLALGLFLFFAVKKAGGTATLDNIKQGRVYEAVLAVAFLALWIAGFCLLGELSRYGYDLKATKVDRGAPTAAS